MRQFTVVCLMVVVASGAAPLLASPVTSPDALSAPSTEAPAAGGLGAGAVLQDYEEDYEDALADGDPEGEDMEAAGALIFRPLFAYRRERQRQARRRRERAHGHYHGRYSH